MYYYCRNTLVCDPKGNMNPFNPLPLVGGADTCQECWVAQPNHYDAQGNYLKSCVHDWATIFSNRIQWKRLTVRNSQSSWFTCFAQDQCRQECRAAFGAFCLFFFGFSRFLLYRFVFGFFCIVLFLVGESTQCCFFVVFVFVVVVCTCCRDVRRQQQQQFPKRTQYCTNQQHVTSMVGRSEKEYPRVDRTGKKYSQ